MVGNIGVHCADWQYPESDTKIIFFLKCLSADLSILTNSGIKYRQQLAISS
jgi:hypothetical protein